MLIIDKYPFDTLQKIPKNMNIKLLATLLVLVDPLQAANLLRGGEIGVSNIPDAVKVAHMPAEQKSKWSLVKAAKDALKKPMNRRTCEVTPRTMAFSSMGVLKADRAYEINIYRGKRDPRTIFTSTGPDNFQLEKGEKWKLIQATPLGNPAKNLCIAAASTQHKGINNTILKRFTQAITAAVGAVDKDAQQSIFKAYKAQIGLPDLFTNFSYNIYAWETDYDCALYNVGVPEAFYPERSDVKQTKTDIFSHIANSGRTFTVQVSKVNVNHHPVSIFQLKTDIDGPSSLRLQPLGFFYKSFPELSKSFPSDYKVETLTFGENDEKCAAFFYQTEAANPFSSAKQVDEYLKIYNQGGINFLRGNKFLEDINFLMFLGSFKGSHTVTCATWLKKNGKCDWYRIDRDSSSDFDSDDDDNFDESDVIHENNTDVTDEELSYNSDYVDSDDEEDSNNNTRSYSENWHVQPRNVNRLTGIDSDDESDMDTQDSDDDHV